MIDSAKSYGGVAQVLSPRRKLVPDGVPEPRRAAATVPVAMFDPFNAVSPEPEPLIELTDTALFMTMFVALNVAVDGVIAVRVTCKNVDALAPVSLTVFNVKLPVLSTCMNQAFWSGVAFLFDTINWGMLLDAFNPI